MSISVKPDSDSISGLEVYLTKEPKVEVKKINGSEGSEKNTDETSREDSELNSDEKFRLLNGETVQIDYYAGMFDNSYEYDYQDISCNASVSMPSVDKNFYKGKKLALLKEWQAPEQKLKWKDLEKVIIGFITEQSYSEEGVSLKIAGITKLLDQEKEFNFSQRKISEILTEMIEAAGLKADVNPKGLKDEVIDYTNISSSGGSGSMSSTGSATIDEAVKNAIAGKTSDLEKAKAIDSSFKSHIIYDLYSDCEHSDLESAWKDGTLNCADGANVLCAMFLAGGLNAVIVHVPPELTQGYGHYIVKVTIKGQVYYTDNAASSGNHTSRPFGEVWLGATSGEEVGTKIPM